MAVKPNNPSPFSATPANDVAAYREAPHNIEAEQLVLGAILTNNEALNRVADFLQAEHFYEPVHRRVYEAILRFSDRGLIASPVTLKNQFDQDEALKEFGGASYLIKIAGLASGILNVKDHASIVYSLAISRQLIEIGEDMVNEAFDSNGELRASEQIERSEQRLFTLASEGNSDSNFQPLRISVNTALETASAAMKREGAISGIPTDFKALDKLLGGMHNSDLIILAARPSMGKTALALNIALNAARVLKEDFDNEKAINPDVGKEPGSVGFISLEMSSEQLASRMLSTLTGINANNIRRGKLEVNPRNDDFAKLVEASKTLHSMPMFIDDTPALSVSALRTRARRLKRKHNLAFLVVDYLQLLRGTSAKAESNRVQEISEISMGLKAIAKELNIPVLALSQLSRKVEERADKRPQLSDLRESGSIEQDADLVMFIYREAYYIEREKPLESEQARFQAWQERMDKYDHIAEIMVSKNRHGPIDNVVLSFNKSTTTFGDYVSPLQEAGAGYNFE